MGQLEQTAVSKSLSPGSYIIRIHGGGFGYQAGDTAEPVVLLWIYGGRFINRDTDVEVNATWVSLNGYEDTLTLDAIDPITVAAFFMDTYREDNEGELTLAFTKL